MKKHAWPITDVRRVRVRGSWGSPRLQENSISTNFEKRVWGIFTFFAFSVCLRCSYPLTQGH